MGTNGIPANSYVNPLQVGRKRRLARSDDDPCHVPADRSAFRVGRSDSALAAFGRLGLLALGVDCRLSRRHRRFHVSGGLSVMLRRLCFHEAEHRVTL